MSSVASSESAQHGRSRSPSPSSKSGGMLSISQSVNKKLDSPMDIQYNYDESLRDCIRREFAQKGHTLDWSHTSLKKKTGIKEHKPVNINHKAHHHRHDHMRLRNNKSTVKHPSSPTTTSSSQLPNHDYEASSARSSRSSSRSRMSISDDDEFDDDDDDDMEDDRDARHESSRTRTSSATRQTQAGAGAGAAAAATGAEHYHHHYQGNTDITGSNNSVNNHLNGSHSNMGTQMTGTVAGHQHGHMAVATGDNAAATAATTTPAPLQPVNPLKSRYQQGGRGSNFAPTIELDDKVAEEIKTHHEGLLRADGFDHSFNALSFLNHTSQVCRAVVKLAVIPAPAEDVDVTTLTMDDVSKIKNFGSASGFLISNRLLMTNYHVFGVIHLAKHPKSMVLFDYNTGTDDHPDTPTPTQEQKGKLCADEFFWCDKHLDVAIVAFQYPPHEQKQIDDANAVAASAALTTTPSTTTTSTPNIRAPIILRHQNVADKLDKDPRLCVVGHPLGHVKRICLHGTRVAGKNVGTSYIVYSNDTQEGSSGCPLVGLYDVIDGWRLIALHHAGILDKRNKLTKLVANWFGKKSSDYIYNQGTLVSVIFDKLITLYQQLRTQPEHTNAATLIRECLLLDDSLPQAIKNKLQPPAPAPAP